MFTGWLSFAGTEVANNARTVAYAQRGLPGTSVRDCDFCPDFHEVVGDKPYTTPFVDADDCPWYDAGNPDSWDFFGFLLLDAEGVEDGTLTASATELATNGGYVSKPRLAGRQMLFKGVLLASTSAGASYGLAWLNKVLEGDMCRSNISCTGDHLCYLTDCPEMCEDAPDLTNPSTPPLLICPTGDAAEYPDACVIPYERHLYKVSTLEAPSVTATQRLNAGWMWDVEFTMYAAVPQAYTVPEYIGTTDLSDEGGEGDVVRTNLSPNPRGNLRTSEGWAVQDEDATDWTEGYQDPNTSLAAGFVRKNWVLDPQMAAGINTGQWRYDPAEGEISATASRAAPDGPPTPAGRMPTYMRTTVATAAPGEPSVLRTLATGYTPTTLRPWTASIYVRRSTAGEVSLLQDSGGVRVERDRVLIEADTWTRVSASMTPYEARTRENLYTNPRLQDAGWGGTGAPTPSDEATGGPDGGAWRKGVITAAGPGDTHVGHTSTYAIEVDSTSETPYQITAQAFRDQGGPVRLYIRRLDAAGAQVGVDIGSPIVQAEPGVWTPLDYIYDAAANPTVASLVVRVVFQGDKAVGDVLGGSTVLVEAADEAGPYFDGDTPDAPGADYAWTGDANASTSTATVGMTTDQANFELHWHGGVDGETRDATAALIDDWPTALEYIDGSRPADGAYRYRWDGPETSSTSSQVPFIRDSPDMVGYQWALATSDAAFRVVALNRTALIQVQPSRWYGARLQIYVPGFPEPNLRIEMQATWMSVTGAPMSAPARLAFINSPAAGWHVLDGKTGLAPAGATFLQVSPVWTARTEASLAVREGQTLAWAARIVEEGSVPPDYFDGAFDDTRNWAYDWTGDEWDSPSEQTVPSTNILVDQVDCPSWQDVPPLADPACLVPEPPAPPVIENDCLVLPPYWRRFTIDIPERSVPEWAEAVPVIRLRSGRNPINQVRYRFYANPFDRRATPDNLGCDFCGEFVVSYLPPNSLLVIDGIEQTAWVETYDSETATTYGSQRLIATHLLYSSDGGPMQWPTLSCDMLYTMTTDTRGNGPTDDAISSLCLAVRT